MTTRGCEPPGRVRLGDGALEVGRIHVEGVGDRHRRTPASRRPRRPRRAVAAKVNAGTKTASPAFTPIAISAIISASRPLDTAMAWPTPAKAASSLLELIDFRAEDELAVGQHGIHAPADIALEPRALALQIEKRDRASGATARAGTGGRHRHGSVRHRRVGVGDRRADALGDFERGEAGAAIDLGRRAGGDAGQERVDLGAEIVVRRERHRLGARARTRRLAIAERRAGKIGGISRVGLGDRELALVLGGDAARRQRRDEAVGERQPRLRLVDGAAHHRGAAGRHRCDRRTGKRQHQVDVVDHQVEHDVDVGRAARPFVRRTQAMRRGSVTPLA